MQTYRKGIPNYNYSPSTIYDCVPFSAMGNALDSIRETEFEPDAGIGQYITMVSGFSLIEQMTLILLKIGYNFDEIASYRGTTRRNIQYAVERCVRRLQL